MPDLRADPDVYCSPDPQPRRQHQRLFRHVMACLDRSPNAVHILNEAASLAEMFGASLSTIRVIPGEPTSGPCADPVDWELRRREELADLNNLAENSQLSTDVDAIVTCGSAGHSIREEADKREVDLVVVGCGTSTGRERFTLGSTARYVADTFPGSVLIVPGEVAKKPEPKRRVIVPFDGSPQAEAALRYASEIAGKRTSELVLLHAVPEVRLGGPGRPDPEDEALLRKLNAREQRAADERMDRLSKLLPTDAHRHRMRRLSGGDPRRALMRAIYEEQGQLVVLSARGRGRDPDLPIGSTAEYLISSAVSPMLLIRSPAADPHSQTGIAPRRPSKAIGRRNEGV